jgi:hypothetical protein
MALPRRVAGPLPRSTEQSRNREWVPLSQKLTANAVLSRFGTQIVASRLHIPSRDEVTGKDVPEGEWRAMTNRMAVGFAVIAVALGAAGMPAKAQQRTTDTVVGSCVYSGGGSHCVRQYRYGDPGNRGIQSLREPIPEEVAELRDREMRWVERCQPMLRRDAYGVGRYVYAARGCEYGRDSD